MNKITHSTYFNRPRFLELAYIAKISDYCPANQYFTCLQSSMSFALPTRFVSIVVSIIAFCSSISCSILIVVVGLAQAHHAQAQERPSTSLDSLERELKAVAWRSDTNTVRVLNALAREYFTRNAARALSLAQHAADLSRALGDTKSLGLSLSNIGAAYYYQSKYDSALTLHLEALKLRERIGDKSGEAASLNNIALIYGDQSRYDLALEYHNKALTLRQSIGDKRGEASSYSNIALVYADQLQYDRALESLVQALGIFRELGDKASEASLLNNIGKIHTAQGNYPEALKCYTESLELKKQSGNQEGQCASLNNISALYSLQNKPQEALKYAQQSLHLAEQIGSKIRQQEALQTISDVYVALGDKSQAFDYYKRYVEVREEVMNQKTQETMLALQAQYESDKKDQEIQLLTKDKELQTTVRNALIAGGVVLVAFLVVAVRRYVEKKRISEEMMRQNEEILRQKKLVEQQSQAIHEANKALEERNEELAEKNREIMDSIFYAERIQSAFLPNTFDHVAGVFEHFVLFKPRDIVSGDFYWAQTIETIDFEKFLIVAAIDCTGHGVPGAFMSMIGNTLLNQIILERRIYTPSQILEELNIAVRRALKQDEEEEDDERNSRDGMDVCICKIELGRVIFAGAKRPLYVVKPGLGTSEIEEIKGDRASIGGKQKEERRTFVNQEIRVTQPLVLYLTTDGFADQPNANNEKYGSRRLREKLTEIALFPARVQRQTMLNELKTFQGSTPQRDDITILGIKLKPSKTA